MHYFQKERFSGTAVFVGKNESAETKVASMLAAGQEVDIVEIRDNTVGAWINNDFLYNYK